MDIALRNYARVKQSMRSSSLQAMLTLLHIPIISTSLAREHKREMVSDSRVGIYRVLGPILYVLSSFLDFLTRKEGRLELFSLFLVALIGVSTAISVTLPFLGINNSYFVIAAMVSVAMAVGLVMYGMVVTFALSSFSLFSQEFGLASSIWERNTVDPYDPVALVLYRIPEHLHERMRRAAAIDGVRVHVESFNFDPLIVVTYDHLLYTETVYIGGWDTGKDAIDKA